MTLWRIGRNDGGTLGGSVGPSFTDDCHEVTFRPGVDDERTAWPPYHHGPLAAWTGWCSKRIVLRFHLSEEPRGRCELRLDVLAVQGPAPDLDVEVNGVRGRWFLDPVRHDRSRIGAATHITGWAHLVVPITALHQGENCIVLATVQEEAAAVGEQGPVHPVYPYFWGSSLQYGMIELVALGPMEPPPVDIRVVPLPLFVRDGAGLSELVDVIVDAPSGISEGDSVVLECADASIHAALDPDGRATGQFRARLRVPDLDGAAREVAVTACIRSHSHRMITSLVPCRKWTVHLVPHVHLDVGYTDTQAKVTEIHSRNLERVLAILHDTPEYRYSVDGSFVVEQFAGSRSDSALDRVLEELRRGRLSLNAFFVLFLTGIASLEECYRAAYSAAALRREQGVPLEYANLTDVPSYSSAIPSILQALGIDGFVGIQNHGRATNEDGDALHLVSPCVWEGPDGAQVLSFFADCYAQLRYLCGHPTTVAGAAQALTRLLRRYERDDYLPSDYPLIGIYSDNEDLGDGEADVVARWNAVYEYPRLRFSTLAEYFESVRPLRERLPVVHGDGGSYWEDGVGADATLTATLRRAQGLVPVAETWGALVSTSDPSLRAATVELDRAWRGLLIGCEHTWTWMHGQRQPHSDQAVDQLAWKRLQVEATLRIGTDETRRALSQLGELVHTKGPSLLVTNALSWEATGIAELELPSSSTLLDANGEELAIDVVAARGDGLSRARVRTAVPAFGYRAFPIVESDDSGDREHRAATWRACDGVVETARHRLTVDVEAGRIIGLYSTSLRRDLLDTSTTGLALGEVLYVLRDPPTGDAPRDSLYDYDRSFPIASQHVMRASMHVDGVRDTPWGAILRLTGDAPSLPLVEVDLELFDDDDSVRVTVRLHKEPVLEKESVYVAFPFAVNDPRLRYDRQQGWVDPQRDHAPGACNEWFTTLYAASVEGSDVAVNWCSADAPLFTWGDIVRGRWPRRVEGGTGTLLSWVMNNHWWTNYPALQEGEVELRYCFRASHRSNAAMAARLGRELRTPPVASTVTWLDKMDSAPRPLDGDHGSLLDIDAPSNLVVTVAQARAADGLLLRVQETAGSAASLTTRHVFGDAAPAWRCNAVEEPTEPVEADDRGRLRVDVKPFEVVSILLLRSA